MLIEVIDHIGFQCETILNRDCTNCIHLYYMEEKYLTFTKQKEHNMFLVK